MNCTDCLDTFTDILDDDVPHDMSVAFKGHLASCPTCAKEFSGFKKTVQTIHSLPQRQVPGDFLIGINNKLDTSTLAKLKNWFAFMGQHKFTASATVATLIIGVISATVLQTPNINQTQLAPSATTYTQASITAQDTKNPATNYYPGIPYITGKQPQQQNSPTPIVQFASATSKPHAGFYGVQNPRGSPQNFSHDAYAAFNTTSGGPKPDFHIIIHPASAAQQQTITRQIGANTEWKTYLHNSTLFVTLTDQQLPEFQQLFPPATPPHKKLDFSPLTEKTDQTLYTIAISFK